MSKYVKYISSKHFGAPVMKGDRWGYLVEMLRTTLVTGFNERTDLSAINVLTSNKISATFESEHKYSENQTIKISDVLYPEINGEYFVDSVTSLTVNCTKCEDTMAGLVGQNVTGTFKSIVAPLGFIEKFNDPDGRSVFTTDEEECYFYIDDRPVVSGWTDGTNTALICPIVFMADKMTDIDTVTGKYIVPFDDANPTQYKLREYTENGRKCMGLWNWLSFGNGSSTQDIGNSPAYQQKEVNWTIIGNGRLFYYIPEIKYFPDNESKKHILCFGKFDGISHERNKNYILKGNSYSKYSSTSYDNGSFSRQRVNQGRGYGLPFNNICYSSNTGAYYNNTNVGRVWSSILSIQSSPSACIFVPVMSNDMSSIKISGSMGTYPDKNTKKYHIYKTKIYQPSTLTNIGNLSGLMWTSNTNNIFNADEKITKYKFNNRIKKIFNFNFRMTNELNPQLPTMTTETYVYNISLEYEDWNNYE